MRALKKLFKDYLLAISTCRNESIEKTAIYFTWHVIAIASINVIAFVVGLFTSFETFVWTLYYSLGLLTVTFIGLFTLTFQSSESFLRKLEKNSFFENAGTHTIYYLLGIINTLLIAGGPRILNETAQVNSVSESMLILLCMYALCTISAMLSQCIRLLLIPYVNKKVLAAFK